MGVVVFHLLAPFLTWRAMLPKGGVIKALRRDGRKTAHVTEKLLRECYEIVINEGSFFFLGGAV